MNDYSSYAEFYDFDQGHLNQKELKFYLELLEDNKSFIEYGSGTGRLLLPLSVLSGKKAFGIELSKEMIKKCLENSNYKNKPIIFNCDITEKINQKIDIGLATNNFISEILEQEKLISFFQNVKLHIKNFFIIDFTNPLHKDFFKMDGWERIVKLTNMIENNNLLLKMVTNIDTDNQLIFTKLTYIQNNFPVNSIELRHRFYYPKQIIDLLKKNGFAIQNIYGDYDKLNFNEHKSKKCIIKSILLKEKL